MKIRFISYNFGGVSFGDKIFFSSIEISVRLLLQGVGEWFAGMLLPLLDFHLNILPFLPIQFQRRNEFCIPPLKCNVRDRRSGGASTREPKFPIRGCKKDRVKNACHAPSLARSFCFYDRLRTGGLICVLGGRMSSRCLGK